MAVLGPPGPGLTPLLGLAKDGVEGWWLTRAGEAWPLGMQGVKPSSSDLCTLGGLEPRKQKKRDSNSLSKYEGRAKPRNGPSNYCFYSSSKSKRH